MAKFSQYTSNGGQKNQKNVTEQELRERFDAYKDMSSSQLNQTLFEEVAKQKANGNFDYQGLEQMVDSMKSFLPAQEFEKVKRLLESLK